MLFLLFQKGGPLSAVPMVLAGGAALMGVAGILCLRNPLVLCDLFRALVVPTIITTLEA